MRVRGEIVVSPIIIRLFSITSLQHKSEFKGLRNERDWEGDPASVDYQFNNSNEEGKERLLEGICVHFASWGLRLLLTKRRKSCKKGPGYPQRRNYSREKITGWYSIISPCQHSLWVPSSELEDKGREWIKAKRERNKALGWRGPVVSGEDGPSQLSGEVGPSQLSG